MRPRGTATRSCGWIGRTRSSQIGDEIRGHEFHYSRIAEPAARHGVRRRCGAPDAATAATPLSSIAVWASYVHVHAAGVPAWADGMIRAAWDYADGDGRHPMSADARRRWPHPIFLDARRAAGRRRRRRHDCRAEDRVAAGSRRARHGGQSRGDRAARRARRRGRLVLHRRAYRRATWPGAGWPTRPPRTREVNRAVRDEAQARSIWFNAVDQPDLCEFITPATVRRGDLTLAISTNGRCPALAKEIRQQLESTFGPEFAEMVERMGEGRDQARESRSDGEAPTPAGHGVSGRRRARGPGPARPSKAGGF